MRYGHFDNEHREYVIEKVDLPTSWTNYLGVENLAVVVNHTAGGYSFYKSPEYHRITRFHGNSIPMDRPGYYVYIRDNEKKEDGTNDYFSISWQPVAKDLDKAKYQCRHGMSYTAYECEYDHIKASQTLFVPIGDDVVLWDVRVKNDGEKVRDLSLFSYLEFSFHSINIDNQNFQMGLYCAGSSYKDGIVEEDLFYEPDGYQYFTANFEPDGFDCMRDKFLGMYHTEDNPVAVINGKCSGSFEKGGNHCGSLQKNIVLQPGEKKHFIFMLGEGNREAGKVMHEKYSNFENVDRAFAELHNYWERKCSKLQIETPNEGMNTLINTWTLYQSEINVMFSRFASFIEVGGRTGLGYRDTAQDAMTIPHSNPEKCRQRIEELLNGLVSKGYGLHLFDPAWFEKKEETSEDEFKSPTVIPTSEKDRIHGPEDACSDDALWLIASIVEYIKETGDVSFADKIVPYADGGEDRVYDHMKAILNFSEEQVGADGICKGLRADWNDYYSDGFEEMLAKAKEAGGSDFYPLLVEGTVLERMVDNSIIVTGDSGTRHFFEEGYIDPAMANANQANDARTVKQIPILGYAYDATNCETQMGSVANVVAEYMLPLCTGAVDPDEKLPEFLQKLDDAGINDILDDANAQLDEFMAAKGN